MRSTASAASKIAGVVDEDVERADVGLGSADEILERLRAGEIPLDPVNRVPEVGDLLDVHRRYDRSLGGEPSAIARPMPLAAPVTSAVRSSSKLIRRPSAAHRRCVLRSFDMATASMVRARNGCSSCSSVSVQPMRITDVEPIVLRLDRVDATRADGTQDAFLVRIHTDEGIVGIGEADTSPYVARTIVEMPSSHSIARGLREVLVGEDPLETDRLWQLMFDASDHYGRGGAALHTISAIDIALWDIAGKAAGRPVSELLGGATDRRHPRVRERGDARDPDEVRRIAERAARPATTRSSSAGGRSAATSPTTRRSSAPRARLLARSAA